MHESQKPSANKWKQAVNEEIQTSKVFNLVDYLSGRKAIGNKMGSQDQVQNGSFDRLVHDLSHGEGLY